VKVQSVQSQVPLVDYESRVYKCLGGGVGIPKMHWHGVDGPYNMLVMDLLGPTITDLLKCFEEFGLELMLLLAQQILDRLEYVHSKDFLYRDVKPQNFMFKRGLKGKHGDLNLYVIDFSLAEIHLSQDQAAHSHATQDRLPRSFSLCQLQGPTRI